MSRRQAEIEQHVASAADRHDTLAVGAFADGEAFFHERGRQTTTDSHVGTSARRR